MDVILEGLMQDWEALLVRLPRVVAALVLLIGFAIAGRVSGAGAARLAGRSQRARGYAQFFRHFVGWTLTAGGLLLALEVAGLRGIAAGLLAAGGVAAVVFGFAFREIGENLLAGFFLSFSRSFQLGDLIQSGEWVGEVRDIELRSVHIRTADGRDIYIPSAEIFRSALVNFTKDGLRRPSFTVGIDYADDAERARRLLLEAVASTPGVLDAPAPTVLLSSLAPQWVELEVAFWSDTFREGLELLGVRSAVMERCRRALREEGMTLSNDTSSTIDLRGGTRPVLVEVEDRYRSDAEGARPLPSGGPRE
jgi:small conductance mechanosensitive channel